MRELHLCPDVASAERDHEGDLETLLQEQHREPRPAEVGVDQVGPVPLAEVLAAGGARRGSLR